MISRRNAVLLSMLLGLVLTGACSKSTSAPPVVPTLTVAVLDQSGLAVAGATVDASGVSATTDASGLAQLNQPAESVDVSATATGYSRSARSLRLPSTARTVVLTLMRADANVVTVHAATGDSVRSSDGSVELIVPPGALDADAQVSLVTLDADQQSALPMPLPDTSDGTGAPLRWTFASLVNWSMTGGTLRPGQHLTFRANNSDTITFPRGSTHSTQLSFRTAEHRWREAVGGTVSADGATITWTYTAPASKAQENAGDGWSGVAAPSSSVRVTVCVTGADAWDALNNPIYHPLTGAILRVNTEDQTSNFDGCAFFLVPRPVILYHGQERRAYATASMHGYTPRISGSWSVWDTLASAFPQINLTLAKDVTTERGTITATVTDAQSGAAVEGALVTIISEGSSRTTDASGTASIGDMSPGRYSLSSSKDGYQSAIARGVEVIANQTATASLAMAPPLDLGQFRFVLSWDITPRDLDLHMTIPGDSAHTSDEIYYSNRGASDSYPYAVLDHDVTSGRGPETITVHRGLDGHYHLFVYKYSSDSTGYWGAQLQVLNRSGLQQTITCPSGRIDQRYWDVLDFDGGTYQISVHNTRSATQPVGSGARPSNTLARK